MLITSLSIIFLPIMPRRAPNIYIVPHASLATPHYYACLDSEYAPTSASTNPPPHANSPVVTFAPNQKTCLFTWKRFKNCRKNQRYYTLMSFGMGRWCKMHAHWPSNRGNFQLVLKQETDILLNLKQQTSLLV